MRESPTTQWFVALCVIGRGSRGLTVGDRSRMFRVSAIAAFARNARLTRFRSAGIPNAVLIPGFCASPHWSQASPYTEGKARVQKVGLRHTVAHSCAQASTQLVQRILHLSFNYC